MKTLVIGLGNPLLTDDGVGLRVASELRSRLAGRRDIDVGEDYNGGLRLMERMIGYNRVVVIDSIRTGAAPGTIHRLHAGLMPTRHGASGHDASLETALEFGRGAGADLPRNENLIVIGVEARDVSTFAGRCTPEVRAAVPSAVDAVLCALEQGGG